MNTKQYLFVAAVAIATFVATTEAQVSILGPGLLNNLCVAQNKKHIRHLAVALVTILDNFCTTFASCLLQYGGGALAATVLLGGLATGALAGALLARGGRGRGYGGYRYGRR